MTYTRQDDHVTLKMEHSDYCKLLVMLGVPVGAVSKGEDKPLFWQFVKFVNALNATNPVFRPYEIPAEFT